jgi:hypothetical protein
VPDNNLDFYPYILRQTYYFGDQNKALTEDGAGLDLVSSAIFWLYRKYEQCECNSRLYIWNRVVRDM